MISFKDMKVGSKILTGNVVLIGLTVILAVFGIFQLNRDVGSFREVYEERVQPLAHLSNISRIILQIRENMLRQTLASLDGDWKSVQEIQAETDRLRQALTDEKQALQTANFSEEEAALFRQYNEAENNARQARERFQAALKDREAEAAARYSDVWARDYITMRDAIDAMVRIQVEQSEKLYKDELSAFRISMILFGLLVLLSIAGAIGIVIYMRQRVAVPLQKAVDTIRDLAEGEGDLTRRLEVSSADEVGEMARWINQFIENIRDIVKEIADNTNEVKSSSNALSGASQNLSAGVEEMSLQSKNISAAATQMNQNFQVVSSSVEELSTSIGEVARSASDASQIAKDADRTAASTNEKIKQLGVDAQEIGKVVEAIQSIASQTNLLALNAAIEAAGAGEAGKGFAVVASEVKELARQASEASDEIKNRIEAIQGSADMAVESIATIASVISKINEFSTTIASAVEEQSITAKEIAGNISQSTQASDDVVRNISGISTATEDGARSAQNLSELATQLDMLSSRLGQIVNRFRI